MAAAGPLPVQNTIEQFKNWARQRKGVFLDTFDESVTHLLCSKEQFEAHGPISTLSLPPSPIYYLANW